MTMIFLNGFRLLSFQPGNQSQRWSRQLGDPVIAAAAFHFTPAMVTAVDIRRGFGSICRNPAGLRSRARLAKLRRRGVRQWPLAAYRRPAPIPSRLAEARRRAKTKHFMIFSSWRVSLRSAPVHELLALLPPRPGCGGARHIVHIPHRPCGPHPLARGFRRLVKPRGH